jgi:hypothetical protein
MGGADALARFVSSIIGKVSENLRRSRTDQADSAYPSIRARRLYCLHQDLYGEIAFPLQFTCALSRRERDFEGGELLLVEQRPRAQSRGEAIALDQGDGIVFANRYRPAPGAKGYHRVNMRHGVSTIRSGTRYAMGVIFHDAA